MTDLLDRLDEEERAKVEPAPGSRPGTPMLATLAHDAFDDPVVADSGDVGSFRRLQGFTDPGGRRKGFGALLVGDHGEGVLRHAGKVGTGDDDDLLRALRRRLDRLERKTPPFEDDGRLPDDGVHRVTPGLVAEVGSTEGTGGGELRHPRFLGLRDDEAAAEVVRERAVRAGAGA